MSKITVERFDFASGTVEKLEREIDSRKVLSGNALFQSLTPKKKRGAKETSEATS